jgi:hypothetical protein
LKTSPINTPKGIQSSINNNTGILINKPTSTVAVPGPGLAVNLEKKLSPPVMINNNELAARTQKINEHIKLHHPNTKHHIKHSS